MLCLYSVFLLPVKKGELSEWLKEHAWKVCIRETVSRVRIPHSPLMPVILNTKTLVKPAKD